MEEGLVAVASVSEELDSLERRLQGLFSLLHDPSILAALPPLHRAAAFLSLSKALNALFALHLRCKGLPPEDQLLNSELERVSLYDSKIGHFIDDLKGPKHRTTVLNVEAANRFIEHAISDLTEEQKKDLQGIKRQCVESKHESMKSRNLPSKPLKPARTQSITEAAAAFLEEAKKDLLEEQERYKAAE
eukprot:c19263_g1_i1 orf=159-725(+)